ncbi:MAG: hypothetical protein ACYC75_02165 [Minisyncoccota bacterium]
MRFIVRSAVLLGAFTLPTLAFALQISWSIGISSGNSCGASSICEIASTILYLINSVLVPLLFAVSFLVFLYGVFKQYILSRGDAEAVAQGHTLILWGIIGFVVMISLWGLVNVVANTFGLWGYAAPPLPTSYPAY